MASDSDSDYDPDLDQSHEELEEEKKAEGISLAANNWSTEEEALLEMALSAYPSEMYPAAFERFVLVASQLPNKTARDVALRVRQLNAQREQQEYGFKPKGDHTSKKRGSNMQLPPMPKSVASNAQRSPRAKPTKQSVKGDKAAGGAFARDAPPPVTQIVPAPMSTDPVLLPLPPPCSKRLLPSLSASCFFQPASNPSTSNSASEEEGILVDMVGGTSSIHHDLLMSGLPGLQINSSGAMQSMERGAAPNLLEVEGMGGMFVHKPPSPSLEAMSLNEIRNLMEQNYGLLNSIKDNMQQCKVVENTELLTHFRDNVLNCIGQLSSLSLSGQMPPLPEQPNLELAAKFLPPRPGMTLLPPVVPPFIAQQQQGGGGGGGGGGVMHPQMMGMVPTGSNPAPYQFQPNLGPPSS